MQQAQSTEHLQSRTVKHHLHLHLHPTPRATHLKLQAARVALAAMQSENSLDMLLGGGRQGGRRQEGCEEPLDELAPYHITLHPLLFLIDLNPRVCWACAYCRFRLKKRRKACRRSQGAQSQCLRSNRHIVVAMDLKETARVLYEEWAAATASQNGAPSKRPTCGWPAGCRISTCRRRATNLFSLNRGWDILPRTNIGHSFADQRTLVS